MSTNGFYLITKEKIDLYLNELGKLINKKRGHNFHSELIIVGGASILLNYGFRLNSEDIDCTDKSGVLMNDYINVVAEKYGLPKHWINTDFIHTKSYSNKLEQYSTFYKSYGFGALEVRTIKDEYLIAMKVVSARKYKNDYSDIFGIVNECRQNGKTITLKLVETAIYNLYGDINVADKSAFDFAKEIIEHPESIDYELIKQKENSHAETVKEIKNDSELDSQDIEYILKKLDF